MVLQLAWTDKIVLTAKGAVALYFSDNESDLAAVGIKSKQKLHN